jgi:hypothetical protein
MAIIKLGGVVTGIRGTVGGVTYSANKGGPYAKAWGSGSNARSALQQERRGNVLTMASAWGGMSDAERDAWGVLAAADPEPTYNSLGELVVMSGWGYFVRCNQRRLGVGLDVLTMAPSGGDAVRPDPIVILTFIPVTAPGPQWDLTWDGSGTPVDSYLVVEGIVHVSMTALYVPVRMRWIGFCAADADAVELGPEAWEVFGGYGASWIAITGASVQRDNGLRSTRATSREVIGAPL